MIRLFSLLYFGKEKGHGRIESFKQADESSDLAVYQEEDQENLRAERECLVQSDRGDGQGRGHGPGASRMRRRHDLRGI